MRSSSPLRWWPCFDIVCYAMTVKTFGHPTNPRTWGEGVKIPPFKFQRRGWRYAKTVHVEHIRTHWLPDITNNLTTFSWKKNKYLNRRSQIDHSMWGRRVVSSPLWWWPCKRCHCQSIFECCEIFTWAQKCLTICVRHNRTSPSLAIARILLLIWVHFSGRFVR